MVTLAQCLGLRVSEIMGLQWADFDFEEQRLLVQRSVVHGRVDEVKTEYSKDYVPLDKRLAAVLLNWRKTSTFNAPEDWVFANPATGKPYYQEEIQKTLRRFRKITHRCSREVTHLLGNQELN